MDVLKAVMSPWILISKCWRVETAATLLSQMVACKPHSKYQSRPLRQNNKRKNLMPLTNWWMILSLMKVRKTRRNSVHLSPFYSLRKTIYWMMLYKKKLLLSKRIWMSSILCPAVILKICLWEILQMSESLLPVKRFRSLIMRRKSLTHPHLLRMKSCREKPLRWKVKRLSWTLSSLRKWKSKSSQSILEPLQCNHPGDRLDTVRNSVHKASKVFRTTSQTKRKSTHLRWICSKWLMITNLARSMLHKLRKVSH